MLHSDLLLPGSPCGKAPCHLPVACERSLSLLVSPRALSSPSSPSLPTRGGLADVLCRGAVVPGLARTTGAGQTCSPHLPVLARSGRVRHLRLWDPETGAACPRRPFCPLPGHVSPAAGRRVGGGLRGTGSSSLAALPHPSALGSPSLPPCVSVLPALLSTVWQVAPSCLVLMSRNFGILLMCFLQFS
jgi:hypothetical protein